MWSFIARVLGLVWKYGRRVVDGVVRYAKAHWPKVQEWLLKYAFDYVITLIRGQIGL